MKTPPRPARKVLFSSRSALFEHPLVARRGDDLSFAELSFTELAGQIGCGVDCTKDGGVFDQDLDPYAAVVTYSCGKPADLMGVQSIDHSAPLTPRGWENLDRAVRAGKPLVGIHPGLWLHVEAFGADCVGHGSQQNGRMRVVAPDFPGMQGLGAGFSMLDEWFSLTCFSPDLHAILVQDCAGMDTAQPADRTCYARPPFPATWARMHGNGRVFYTSMGHREDVWTRGIFRQVLAGGLAWALGDVSADLTPNLSQTAPEANAFGS